jgi:hypothetical protein
MFHVHRLEYQGYHERDDILHVRQNPERQRREACAKEINLICVVIVSKSRNSILSCSDQEDLRQTADAEAAKGSGLERFGSTHAIPLWRILREPLKGKQHAPLEEGVNGIYFHDFDEHFKLRELILGVRNSAPVDVLKEWLGGLQQSVKNQEIPTSL